MSFALSPVNFRFTFLQRHETMGYLPGTFVPGKPYRADVLNANISPDMGSAYVRKAIISPDMGSVHVRKAIISPDKGSAYIRKAIISPDMGSAYIRKAIISPDIGSAYIFAINFPGLSFSKFYQT